MAKLIQRHPRADLGQAVFWTTILFGASLAAGYLWNGNLVEETRSVIADVMREDAPNRSSRKVGNQQFSFTPEAAQNLPAFDAAKGGDRVFVLNYMNSVANRGCTLDVMRANRLNQPGSPCQSFGSYLIYFKTEGTPQIVLGEINGRNIRNSVVVTPHEWSNGEWKVSAVADFNWKAAANLLSQRSSAGN